MLPVKMPLEGQSSVLVSDACLKPGASSSPDVNTESLRPCFAGGLFRSRVAKRSLQTSERHAGKKCGRAFPRMRMHPTDIAREMQLWRETVPYRKASRP